jgi:hypothetical protein
MDTGPLAVNRPQGDRCHCLPEEDSGCDVDQGLTEIFEGLNAPGNTNDEPVPEFGTTGVARDGYASGLELILDSVGIGKASQDGVLRAAPGFDAQASQEAGEPIPLLANPTRNGLPTMSMRGGLSDRKTKRRYGLRTTVLLGFGVLRRRSSKRNATRLDPIHDSQGL